MQKIFLFRSLVFIVLLLIITSCKRDYERTLEDYLKYIKKGNYKKAYELLSSEDKSVISYESFSNNDDETQISKNISKRIIYKIKDSSYSETGSVVKVNVLVNKIDLKKAFYLIPELLDSNLSEKEVDKIFIKKSKILKACYIASDVEYKLIKEDSEWKINADFGRKKMVSMLLTEADEYFKNNDYKFALDRYKEVLEFDEGNINALDKLMLINEKMDYINNFLEIKHVFFEKNKKGAKISLTIVNNGTIVVKRIFVNFIFYDNSGNVIYQNKREVLNSSNKKIGYNESIKTIINFEDISAFYNVECVMSAIDF